MNVYDEAHSLARAIRESNEFKEFDRIRKEVDNDKECAEMLKELTELQMQRNDIAIHVPQFLKRIRHTHCPLAEGKRLGEVLVRL